MSDMENIIELKKDEPTEFAIGDVVTLRSGGAKTTVKKVWREKGIVRVSVDWMDHCDALFDATFDARQLKAATADGDPNGE